MKKPKKSISFTGLLINHVKCPAYELHKMNPAAVFSFPSSLTYYWESRSIWFNLHYSQIEMSPWQNRGWLSGKNKRNSRQMETRASQKGQTNVARLMEQKSASCIDLVVRWTEIVFTRVCTYFQWPTILIIASYYTKIRHLFCVNISLHIAESISLRISHRNIC